MKHEQLCKHFEAIGARVKFRPLNSLLRRMPNTKRPSFTIDVHRDRRGEYFDFALGDEAPEFKLLQVRPKERHLLLFATDGQRFLCGHDERHWFVAGVEKPVSTVRAAKQALLPPEIWEQIKNLPPDEVDNRRNVIFKRQGEWYFVPVRREIPEMQILKNEPLQRTSTSKPHICQELYREGGELVYIASGNQYTEEEYQKKKEENPDSLKYGVYTMMANPTVYVRGYVKHKDHATVTLDGWHRVFINAEVTTSSVSFLD